MNVYAYYVLYLIERITRSSAAGIVILKNFFNKTKKASHELTQDAFFYLPVNNGLLLTFFAETN